MLTFFSIACVWLLLDAEFLALALVVVYVGAVMVLFMFVVMMLDIKVAATREGFIRFLPVGIAVAVVMLLEMLALIGVRAMRVAPPADPATAHGMANIQWLGQALYTRFLLPFEVAALILTVGLVAAVALTLRRREGVRHQDVSRQVRAQPRDRVRSGQHARRTHRGAQIMISLAHYIVFGAVLFCIAVAGIFINRKNVIVLLMTIELMLLAVNTNFIAFSRFIGDPAGQVFVFFIMTVAAAESAIGLAILILLFRNRHTINVAELDDLRG